VLNVIGAICIACSSFRSNGRGVLFTVVALTGLSYTLLIMYAYTFHAVEKHHNWKWLKVELGAAVAFVFFNMITSTIVVGFGAAAYSAAGFFGYLCMVAYGADAFLRGRALRRGEPAQGHVVQLKHAPARPLGP
ncbi:putative F28H1.4a, partial [Operophtera brumata]